MIRKGIIILLTLGSAGCVVLWISSYVRARYVKLLETDAWVVSAFAGNGYAAISCAEPRAWEPYVCPGPRSFLRRYGPVFASRGHALRFLLVGVAIWLPTLLFALYPTIAFIRGPVRRWRRRRRGRCIRCGHDLTGNVSGICPECGMEIHPP